MAFSNTFATYLIIGPTCFFLGICFCAFPYDYYVIWATPPGASPTDMAAREPYLSLLEEHLKILYNSPPLINRILHAVIGVGLLGLMMKLYKPTESNKLFDGATLVLYMCGIAVYVSNILRGMRMANDGAWSEEDNDKKIRMNKGPITFDAGEIVGREDSLKVLAASDTILALLLVGVLILQAGQWYAQKKEAEEIEAFEREAEEKKALKEKEKSPAGQKKKQ